MSPHDRGVATHGVFLMLAGSVVVSAVMGHATSTEVECQSPFTEVGGHCVHLDHSVTGTWREMQQFCQDLGGDLINLGDVQFYEDILAYIRVLGRPLDVDRQGRQSRWARPSGPTMEVTIYRCLQEEENKTVLYSM
ncbi:hypothetical protein O3P69_015468 [Scylla paramamosain]|uniref:Uncharacterized protein n=1 Tax=Scylla paramamosain TaxID=85552 RepID=A0AAW0T6S6_SCYPA